MPLSEERLLASALSPGAVLEAAALLLVFVGVLFLGSMALPGTRIEGPQVDGKSRTYRLNGLTLFLATVVVMALAHVSGWFSLSALHTRFAALFVAANVFSFALSGLLYWRGARAQEAAPGFWRGFFFGRDLSPAWFGVDLKMFSYRPSLIGLALFNASFAVAQYETYGGLTPAMALYQVFTFLYVLNYFQFEHGMVHTWDLISERFGWMLVWGDYVLVPFFYCLAGWWLVDAPGQPLSPMAAGAIVLLFISRFLAVPRRQRTKAPLQARPRGHDLGATRPVPGRPPAGLRVLGHRAASQLYRRDLYLPRVRADHRVRILGALPAACVAGVPVVASLEAR